MVGQLQKYIQFIEQLPVWTVAPNCRRSNDEQTSKIKAGVQCMIVSLVTEGQFRFGFRMYGAATIRALKHMIEQEAR